MLVSHFHSKLNHYYIKVEAVVRQYIGSWNAEQVQSPNKNIQVIPPPSIHWSSEVTPDKTITVDVNELLDFAPIVVYNDGGNSPEGYVSVVTDSHYLQLLYPTGYSGSPTAVYDGQHQRVYLEDGRYDHFDGYLADAWEPVSSNDYVGFAHLYIKPTAVGTYHVYWRAALDTPDTGYNFVRSPTSGEVDPLGYFTKHVTVIAQPQTGSIYATSNPTGANVYLDGAYKGVSPKTISDVSVGSHTVKFTKAGYLNCEKPAPVTANQQTDVNCVLTTSNNAPNTPSTPSGPSPGNTGISYTYSTSATDPDGDQVKYTFDWGDGTTSETGFVNSGTSASRSHSWSNAGTYYVKAKATDSKGAPSGWSSSKVVVIVQTADAAIALELAASGGWDPAADMNHDSRITSLDALMIMQAAAGAIAL